MTMRVRIEGTEGCRTFECDGELPILQAALAAGVPLKYECATGTCGTCKAKLLHGSIETGWAEAPGLVHVAKEGGVLLCQARPTSDCCVSVPTKLAETAESLPLPRRLVGKVTSRRRLTHDVIEVTVTLRRPLQFLGGQFVLLDWPGVAGSRAYSMVDAPGSAATLRFAIKNKAGGAVSRRLFDQDLPQDDVHIFGPLGHAHFDPDAAGDMLLLAGGSGLGPLLSVLQAAAEAGALERQRARLVFGVRTEKDLFYLEELRSLQVGREDALAITVALSEQDAARRPALPPTFELASGMVHEVAGTMLDAPISDHQAFVAGPPPMVDACLRVLLLKGRVSPARIKYDKYS